MVLTSAANTREHVLPEESAFQLSGGAAAVYERIWVPAIMGRSAEQLVEAAGIGDGDHVLDIACGTGIVARTALPLVGPAGRVVATDLNAAMLEEARAWANRHGAAAIEWHKSEAARLPFDNASFDAVLCQQGLQFMPDRAAVLREMVRVLRPQGRVALSVWQSESPVSAAICRVLERHFGDGSTADWKVTYSLSDRGELRRLASDAGFRDIHVSLDFKVARHPDPKAFVSGALAGSPHADDIAALPDETRAALVDEVIANMAGCIDDDGVASGVACHTLTARR